MSNLDENSIIAWLNNNKIVNEKGQRIGFNEHFFLYDIYKDWSPRQVYKKAAQIGMSVTMTLKALYAAKHKGLDIIYTLPSQSDVWEFVPSKADKIMQSNDVIRESLQTDKTEMKQIKDRFIHYKGTISKTAPIMTTADLLIHDEIDRSDQGIVDTYSSRISRSDYKGIWKLSNPSVIKSGVDVDWRKSDQKEWHITCDDCNYEQVLSWDRNVDKKNAKYVCANCGEELKPSERALGEWKPTADGEISGYHISQLMAPWISVKDILEDVSNKDEDYLYNFVLGEPVQKGDIADFRTILYDSWTPRPMDKKPMYMGIDIGRVKHYVLGGPEGIFRIGTCESREEVERIIERYNPYVVMDAGPERTWAEEFRKKYPKLYINFYKRDKDRKEIVRWGEEKDRGIVWSDRNRAIDAMIDDLVIGDILLDLKQDNLEELLKHFDNITRKEEEDKLGRKRYIWETHNDSAPDHWVHALVYYWIARKRGGKKATVVDDIKPNNDFVQITTQGFKERDLQDYLDNKYL